MIYHVVSMGIERFYNVKVPDYDENMTEEEIEAQAIELAMDGELEESDVGIEQQDIIYVNNAFDEDEDGNELM